MYYFMMIPTGYFICNVCGTIKGNDGIKRNYYIYFDDIKNIEDFKKLFEIKPNTSEKDIIKFWRTSLYLSYSKEETEKIPNCLKKYITTKEKNSNGIIFTNENSRSR